MPDDVFADMTTLLAEHQAGERGRGFTHLLSCRRNRHRFNSYGFALTGLQTLAPRNLAYLNPADMQERMLRDGDSIDIASDHGTITATVAGEATIRRGVVSLSHGFGGLPDEDLYQENGVSANLLISTDRDRQSINGMPRMSGIPVNIRPARVPHKQQAGFEREEKRRAGCADM
jgi:anaerobic selenocysteine-containing dehydrogenase